MMQKRQLTEASMSEDITTMSDEDLTRRETEAAAERARRQTVTEAVRRTDDLCLTYLIADGRQQGDPWQPPLGIVGAYPTGWVAEHDGRMWAATAPGLIDPPSDTSAGWGAHEGPVIEFWQAGPYEKGDRVRDGGQVWVAIADVDGLRPSDYPGGWIPA